MFTCVRSDPLHSGGEFLRHSVVAEDHSAEVWGSKCARALPNIICPSMSSRSSNNDSRLRSVRNDLIATVRTVSMTSAPIRLEAVPSTNCHLSKRSRPSRGGGSSLIGHTSSEPPGTFGAGRLFNHAENWRSGSTVSETFMWKATECADPYADF